MARQRLAALALVASAVMKLSKSPEALKGFSHLGYSQDLALWLGIVEVSCVVLYLFPYTAALGAVLMTGYLGGAIATHLRVGETANMVAPAVLGVLAWGGLFLRDRRVRAILPFRT